MAILSNKRILIVVDGGSVERVITTEKDVDIFIADKDILNDRMVSEYNADLDTPISVENFELEVVSLERFEQIAKELREVEETEE